MRLVHELEQLVNHCLEELPVRLQESRILADNVHNVTRHDSLVVLSTLHLGQAQKVLDHGYQESLLGLLVHGQRDGSDRPAQDVAVVPRPLRAVHLARQLLRHDVLRVDHVKMG